jgi:hypothetical protein
LIDGDTELEGKLQIGSQAVVEYRPADGKNVAIHVVVAPAAGLKATVSSGRTRKNRFPRARSK